MQQQDEILLQFVKKYLSAEQPIIQYRGYCFLAIIRAGLLTSLNRWGITERKSKTIEFPSNMPKRLLRHFIRGCWDGDGSIVFHRKEISQTWYQACKIVSASEQFLLGLEVCLKESNIESYINVEKRYGNRSNLYSLHIKKSCLIDFHKFLYKDAEAFLPRKKAKFDELIEHRKQYINGTFLCEKKLRIRKTLTKKYLLENYIKKNKSAKLIADELKVNRTIIFKYLRKYGIRKV